MTVALPISEPSPDDWPRRQRIKTMVRSAARRGLREALLVHSLSLFGRNIWSLDDAQLDDLSATFGAVFSLLDEQLQHRDLH